MKCAEIFATILHNIPMCDTRPDRSNLTAFGYWLLYNPPIFGKSSTTEIPDITGMQR
jgi:hypothetical protein